MQKIVCFGTGRDGKAFLSIASTKVAVDYFLDNHKAGKWEGYRVYPPSKEKCEGKFIVVTTTEYYVQIKKQLETYGLQEKKDFISLLSYLAVHDEFMRANAVGKIGTNLYIRPKKKQLYLLHHCGSFPQIEGLTSKSYDYATILPKRKFPDDITLWGRGGVVEQSGEYVRESAIESYMEGKYELDSDVKFVDEKVVYCGDMYLQWGHHLIDNINRMWYFFENDFSVDKYIFTIAEDMKDKFPFSNYEEVFRLLGILNKLELISEPVKYRQVIVPQASYNKAKYYAKQYKDMLDVIIKNALKENKRKDFCKRIYFSRNEWNKAEYGQEAIENFFLKNGFQIVYPEKIPLVSMIAMAQNAEIIGAPSGSVAHNILFARDGTQVIWIEKSAIYNQHQANIDRIKQLDISYVDANAVFFPVGNGNGPFIFLWNDWLERFAKNKHWNFPDKEFWEREYIERELKAYFENRKREKEQDWNELFEEAYVKSKQYLKSTVGIEL